VRGLKYDVIKKYEKKLESHSSWVRGLKFTWLKGAQSRTFVALFMGAWIEISAFLGCAFIALVALFMGAWIEMPLWPTSAMTRMASHSSWVRGLKFLSNEPSDFQLRRTLHGCVDWNISHYSVGYYHSHVALFMGAWIEILIHFFRLIPYSVALFMGAWIEILYCVHRSRQNASHSSWVRGLK